MNNFVRQLLTEWRKLGLPFADETFIVAVSGGADSVSLLLALHELRKLKKLNLRFVIAHFNHDLRGAESAKDVEFVRGLTTKFNFEFVFKIQNPKSKIQNQRSAGSVRTCERSTILPTCGPELMVHPTQREIGRAHV